MSSYKDMVQGRSAHTIKHLLQPLLYKEGGKSKSPTANQLVGL